VTIRPSALVEYNLARGPLCERTLSASSAGSMPLAELLEFADPGARRLWDGLGLDYATIQGLPVLREEIAGLYETVGPDGVLGFSGAQEAIFCLVRGLLDPGDHAVVVTPCYGALLAVPKAIPAEVTEVRLRHEDGWRLDVDRVADAFRPDTRLLVLNFPHNPTGATLSEASLTRLLDLARATGARVLSDEVFRLLDADVPVPAADLYERAISLDVMSKAWGLGGVRVGWIATRDEAALAAARGVKGWTSICTGTPDEVLALVAIRARERILAANLAVIRENLDVLDFFFARNRDVIEWVRPRAGCLAFPRLPGGDADALADRMARDEKILVLPGRLFYGGRPHFRLGYGRPGLRPALERLEAVLREG